MKVGKRTAYSKDFKTAAVKKSINSPFTVKSVAEELGVHPQLLSKWRRELTKITKPAKEKIKNKSPEKSYSALEKENRLLKKKLKKVELEAAILKKADEYFARKLK